MPWYKCQISYKPRTGGQRQVTETFEAKNSVDARARAEAMYNDTVRVQVGAVSKPR